MESTIKLCFEVFLLWAALSVVSAKSYAGVFGLVGQGNCPEAGAQKDFDANRFAGVWYKYAKYNLARTAGTKCGQATVKVKENGHLGFLNTMIRDMKIFGFTFMQFEISANGELTPIDGARMSMSYTGYTDLSHPNTNIVETDYDHYSVVLSCIKYPMAPINIQELTIWTRKRGVAPPHFDEIKARLDHAHVNVEKLILEDQAHCKCPVTAAQEAKKHDEGLHQKDGHHKDGHHHEDGHHHGDGDDHHKDGHHAKDGHHHSEHHKDGHHHGDGHHNGDGHAEPENIIVVAEAEPASED